MKRYTSHPVLPCVWVLLSEISPRQVHQSLTAMLWFAFILSIVAILQHYTSPGNKIFWLWDLPSGHILPVGSVLSRHHWGAVVEAVLPIAIYRALRFPDSLWLYATMAGTLYASVIAGASRAGTVLCTFQVEIHVRVEPQTSSAC